MTDLELSCVIKKILVAVCYFLQVFQLASSTCSSPPKPYGTSYNGTTNRQYGEGTSLAYSCMIGYSMIDTSNNVRRCLRDGSWSGSDQICILNFFDVFLSLIACLGAVVVFIFLVCCRIYIQGKRESPARKHERKSNKKSKRDNDLPSGILRNGGPIAENPYDIEMTNIRDHRLVHAFDEDDSDEGTLNKALSINDDLDDQDKHEYEISVNHFDDEYSKPNDSGFEKEELKVDLKPKNGKLTGSNKHTNDRIGSKHYGKSKGRDRSTDNKRSNGRDRSKDNKRSKLRDRSTDNKRPKGLDRSTDNNRSKGRDRSMDNNWSMGVKAKRVKRNRPQELDEYLKPGLKVDMTNASPLYYTPSFAKQGTGWIHDDTSFDSLELEIDDAELKRKDTRM